MILVSHKEIRIIKICRKMHLILEGAPEFVILVNVELRICKDSSREGLKAIAMVFV